MSFSASSKDISITQTTLHAECRKRDGTYVPSSLELNTCIENKEGALVWANQGNFGNSANNITLRGVILEADCRKTIGMYVSASINLDERITNDDGVLKFNL